MDYRDQFAEFDGVSYLDTSAQGPLPLAAERAARAALEWKKLPHTIPPDIYFALPDRVRAAIAVLIHADGDDIAITTGASTGMSAVASGMDWKAGDEILVGAGEFPAHFATWLPLERAGLARMRLVQPRERFLKVEDYIEAMGPRVRLVSISLVRFDDAARMDIPVLAEACRASGVLLLVDASQCCGAIPIDVRSLGADFLVSAGYKWLLSPYGTGFFWARPECAERLGPGPLYWPALEGSRDYHGFVYGDMKPVKGARRWDAAETASFTNLAAMEASLEFVGKAGVETVEQHNAKLIEMLLARLPLDRCVLASPAEPARRGTYVCIQARRPERTREIHQILRDAKIYVSLRQNSLRIAPHLYNTPQDIERLLAALSS
jgi:selenocysteine lyase/cysteine desulfurase